MVKKIRARVVKRIWGEHMAAKKKVEVTEQPEEVVKVVRPNNGVEVVTRPTDSTVNDLVADKLPSLDD